MASKKRNNDDEWRQLGRIQWRWWGCDKYNDDDVTVMMKVVIGHDDNIEKGVFTNSHHSQ